MLGIVTPQEYDAYEIMYFAGLAMQRFVDNADLFPSENVEILEKDTGVTEIRIPKETFENYLIIAITDGILCLEEKYWVNLPHTPKPQIINPDFERKAAEWLKKEVYSRISNKEKFSLLEEVLVQQEDTGKILLQHLQE